MFPPLLVVVLLQDLLAPLLERPAESQKSLKSWMSLIRGDASMSLSQPISSRGMFVLLCVISSRHMDLVRNSSIMPSSLGGMDGCRSLLLVQKGKRGIGRLMIGMSSVAVCLSSSPLTKNALPRTKHGSPFEVDTSLRRLKLSLPPPPRYLPSLRTAPRRLVTLHSSLSSSQHYLLPFHYLRHPHQPIMIIHTQTSFDKRLLLTRIRIRVKSRRRHR